MYNENVLKIFKHRYLELVNIGIFENHHIDEGHFMFLKWEDEIVGLIHSETYNVVLNIEQNDVNHIFNISKRGKDYLTIKEWNEFISDRIISSSRRDINKFLYKYGISKYDPLKISKITRCINANDKLWIAFDMNEKYKDIVENVFDNIIMKNQSLSSGGTIYSPGGMNTKEYGSYNGKYGIFKKRLSPVMKDVESEIAVYKLSKLLGINCCPVYRVDKDVVFSEFTYDFKNEYIVHFRRLLPEPMPENITQFVMREYPQYKQKFFNMLVLDFITRQADRHPSNYSIKISKNCDEFYDLYDNGRSLFFEDTEEMVEEAVQNPMMYATTFGFSGTYYDHICDMLKDDITLADYIYLDRLSPKDIYECLKESGFEGYRLDGAQTWIMKTIDIFKETVHQISMNTDK